MIRLFIAIHLPDTVMDYLTGVIENLKPLDPNIKWVHPANLHLTLKFLGETPDDKLEEIRQHLSLIHQQDIKLSFKGLGCFPNIVNPKVLWIGLSGDIPALVKLSRDVDKKMAKCGFKKEKRPFAPHITLARIKNNISEELKREILNQTKIEYDDFICKRFSLIESQLTPKGSIYTDIEQYPLLQRVE